MNKLFNYALRLLGRQQYSVAGMETKLAAYLQKRKLLESSTAQVIERLLKLNYLNDAQFASMAIAASLRRKPQGLTALRNNLKLKGIPADIIKEVIKKADIDEQLYARRAATKKLKLLGGEHPRHSAQAQKEKLIRFLAARGFSASTIYKVIDGLPSEY